MNALVCIGSKGKSVAHAWVVTIGLDGTVLFWESLTGQRFECIFSKSFFCGSVHWHRNFLEPGVAASDYMSPLMEALIFCNSLLRKQQARITSVIVWVASNIELFRITICPKTCYKQRGKMLL